MWKTNFIPECVTAVLSKWQMQVPVFNQETKEEPRILFFSPLCSILTLRIDLKGKKMKAEI
jgi:hypothetical protein